MAGKRRTEWKKGAVLRKHPKEKAMKVDNIPKCMMEVRLEEGTRLNYEYTDKQRCMLKK